MKRDRIDLGGRCSVEACRTADGHTFVGYANDASALFMEPKPLRRFLRLAPGTPSRTALDTWMAELGATTGPLL